MSQPYFRSRFFVQDVWINIFYFVDAFDILSIRQVCRRLRSMTRLKPVWYSQFRSSWLCGECPSLGSPSAVASMSSDALEYALLRSLSFERRLARSVEPDEAFPLRVAFCLGRPNSRITWMRLIHGSYILQASSDGFMRCLAVPSKHGQQPEVLGEWAGLGVITSGSVIAQDNGNITLAVATDLQDSFMHIVSIEFGSNPKSPGLTFSRPYTRPGSSGIFASNSKIVCATFYSGRNCIHALVLESDLVVQLGIEEAPQTVHCGVVTLKNLLVVKDLVLELYSMENILQATSSFQRVLPLQRFDLEHMAWKAIATVLPLSQELLSPIQDAFGVVVMWHGGISLFTISASESTHTSCDSRCEFVLRQNSRLPVTDSVVAMAMGDKSYRIVWVECRQDTSILLSTRLPTSSSLNCSSNACTPSLTPPQRIWTGEPPGILHHCDFCCLDEASGLFLVAQTYSGVAWILSYSPLHEAVQERNEARLRFHTRQALLGDRFANVIRGEYACRSQSETTEATLEYISSRRAAERQAMVEVTKDWYLVPSELVPEGFTNDWRSILFEWTYAHGVLRDLIRTVFHVPGTPKFLLKRESTASTFFVVDGYIYQVTFDKDYGVYVLQRPAGYSDRDDFLRRLKEERVTWENHPCRKCWFDSSALHAVRCWDQDHEYVETALGLRPAGGLMLVTNIVTDAGAQHQYQNQYQAFDAEQAIDSEEFCRGQKAAYRLMLGVEPGVRRRRPGGPWFDQDCENRTEMNEVATDLGMTVDSLRES